MASAFFYLYKLYDNYQDDRSFLKITMLDLVERLFPLASRHEVNGGLLSLYSQS